jgi:hypothetical protein
MTLARGNPWLPFPDCVLYPRDYEPNENSKGQTVGGRS